MSALASYCARPLQTDPIVFTFARREYCRGQARPHKTQDISGLREPADATRARMSLDVRRFRALKAKFDRTHVDGIDAQRRGQYHRIQAAIILEGTIIDEARKLIDTAAARVRKISGPSFDAKSRGRPR